MDNSSESHRGSITLPRWGEVFDTVSDQDIQAFYELQDAGITRLIQLICITRSDLAGLVSEQVVAHTEAALRRHGLQFRDTWASPSMLIRDHYGPHRLAPMALLQFEFGKILRRELATFRPLRIIAQLQLDHPNWTIDNLVAQSRSQLFREIQSHYPKMSPNILSDELSLLEARLKNHGNFQLSATSQRQWLPRPRRRLWREHHTWQTQ